jgi:hypothetical protein
LLPEAKPKHDEAHAAANAANPGGSH